MSNGRIGLTVAVPMRSNCSAVLTYRMVNLARDDAEVGQISLTLLIWVGRTSAEGMEKSQYLWNVFWREMGHVMNSGRARDDLPAREATCNGCRTRRG